MAAWDMAGSGAVFASGAALVAGAAVVFFGRAIFLFIAQVNTMFRFLHNNHVIIRY